MTTEVIILAQGTQSRLGMHHGYKQLLPLPACDGVGILIRTLAQLASLRLAADLSLRVTVVAWGTLQEALWMYPAGARIGLPLTGLQLPDPGNSSLKGICRYLAQRASAMLCERTIVLLGDVVYSWACLEALLARSNDYGFVGTRDLSQGAGELWGVAWHHTYEDMMLSRLRDALLRHPPFDDTYQPGQMRRWISGWERGDLTKHIDRLRFSRSYVDIDDYTRDIDLPEHLKLLPALSEQAAADDRAHGILWSRS